MSKESKRMLAVVAAFVLTAAVFQVGNAAGPSEATRNLLHVSVNSESPQGTEIILVGDGEFRYESFVLDNPDRLVIDLPGVVSRLDRDKIQIDDGSVTRVRAAQHRSGVDPMARVVVDLAAPVDYEFETRGDDLVVSFGSKRSAEPALASLIDELESRHAIEAEPADTGRSVDPEVIERVLGAPSLAAPTPYQESSGGGSFQTQTISAETVSYSGKQISLNLVDADIKQVFRLFHEISGLNFVLDPSVAGQVTIVLDNVPWDQALDIILKNNGLDKVLEANVIRIATTQKLAQEAASRKQLKEAKELEVEPITITRTLSYAKAAEVERVVRDSGVLTSRGRVIVDERTNTLIISDIPKKVQPLDKLISTLDAETPQVMIEARVVETSRDFVQDLGVVWGATAIADASRGTSTGLSFPHNASVRYGLNLPGEGGASSLAFKLGNVIDSFTLDVALNTLETEGTGRVLSSPKIATQNNERAEIEQGVRIPIVNTTATEINVEFVSASLKMTVTPQITAEGTIILDVIVENNSPDFVNTAGGVPSIRTQRAQTKVLISDGGTTVIGGIFTVNEGRSEVGVPWFRKVPVFGWLFKTQNITNQNRELLIFITPKIMRAA